MSGHIAEHLTGARRHNFDARPVSGLKLWEMILR
jgi:hypothetical protein